MVLNEANGCKYKMINRVSNFETLWLKILFTFNFTNKHSCIVLKSNERHAPLLADLALLTK